MHNVDCNAQKKSTKTFKRLKIHKAVSDLVLVYVKMLEGLST